MIETRLARVEHRGPPPFVLSLSKYNLRTSMRATEPLAKQLLDCADELACPFDSRSDIVLSEVHV